MDVCVCVGMRVYMSVNMNVYGYADKKTEVVG